MFYHYHLSTGDYKRFLNSLFGGILIILVLLSLSVLFERNNITRIIQVIIMVVGPIILVFYIFRFSRKSEVIVHEDKLQIDNLTEIPFAEIKKYQLNQGKLSQMLILFMSNGERLFIAPETSMSSFSIDKFKEFAEEFENNYQLQKNA